MKTMTMQDRQTLASRYTAGENVTQIAVDLGMSAAAVYAELRRGYTGGLDGNKRREYDPELGLTRYQESLANRGRRNPAGDKRSRNDAGYSCGGKKILGKGHGIITEFPSMGSDDFSVFLEYSRGVQFFVGSANNDPATKIGLHCGDNVFDESALSVGVSVLTQYVLDALGA